MERNLNERISRLEGEREAERLRTSEYEELLNKGITEIATRTTKKAISLNLDSKKKN